MATQASAGAPGASATRAAGRPQQPKAAPKAGLRPAAQHFFNLHPRKGQGSARSWHLAKAASLGLLTRTWGCSWGQRAPQGRDTDPEYRAGTLAGHQQDWRPRSIGRDPGPGYGRVTVPTLPLSGFAPSSESRGKARQFLHPCVFGDLPVAAQSSSFPPGKSKLHCSVSKGGQKHKHACSLTPTKGKTGGEDRGGEDSPRRGSKFCAANLLGSHPYR